MEPHYPGKSLTNTSQIGLLLYNSVIWVHTGDAGNGCNYLTLSGNPAYSELCVGNCYVRHPWRIKPEDAALIDVMLPEPTTAGSILRKVSHSELLDV